MKHLLHPLQGIEPTEEALHRIKAKIDARIDGGTPVPSPYMAMRRVNRFILAGCSTAVLVLAFSFALDANASMEEGMLSAKMAFSPNAHTKSQLALSSLEKSTALAENALEDADAYERLGASVALSRKTLDTLQLMGEDGKYTMEECLGDYKKYYNLLSSMEERLASSPISSRTQEEKDRVEALKGKIHDAKEEAEDRLGKYPDAN